MEDAGDENAALFLPVEKHVAALLKMVQAGTNEVAGTAKRGVGGQHLSELFKPVEISYCLGASSGLKSVGAYTQQVGPSAQGKAHQVHG